VRSFDEVDEPVDIMAGGYFHYRYFRAQKNVPSAKGEEEGNIMAKRPGLYERGPRAGFYALPESERPEDTASAGTYIDGADR